MNFGGLARRQAGQIIRPKSASLYSSLAPATETSAPRHDPSAPLPVLEHVPYHIHSGVVLSRSPVLTRDLSPFEASFYFYQRRLDARLALPFTRALYYKPGTLAAAEYKKKLQEFQKTNLYYNPYHPTEGFKDELLVGQQAPGTENYGYDALAKYTVSGEEALEKASEGVTEESNKIPFDRPFPRETEADRTGDNHRLDRKLSRTLYLLVKGKEEGEEAGKSGWRFPSSGLAGKESVKDAAWRTLIESCGRNMNVWFPGNVPSGHYSFKYANPISESAGPIDGRKTFFMKARILAGQVKLDGNPHGWKDYAWVTKDEMEDIVGQRYFYAVRHMLHNR